MELWNKCSEKLENTLSQEDFNTWIRPLKASQEKNTLELVAPNDFILNYIEKNFAKEIKKHIIVTRGDKGAISIIGDKITETEAKKDLKIRDLTGAGDLFAAGYLHGFINNLSSEKCLEEGTRLSSRVIQQIGARF